MVTYPNIPKYTFNFFSSDYGGFAGPNNFFAIGWKESIFINLQVLKKGKWWKSEENQKNLGMDIYTFYTISYFLFPFLFYMVFISNIRQSINSVSSHG